MLTAPPAIASSMVIPSGQKPHSSSRVPNGYLHSIADEDAPAEFDVAAQIEPTPSEPVESHPVSESSPEPDAADDSYDAQSPASDGEDEDVVMDNSGDELGQSSRENSSSPEPDRGVKRKSS